MESTSAGVEGSGHCGRSRSSSSLAQTLFKWWLGLRIFRPDEMCPRCPAVVLDQPGQHALTCRRGPEVGSRHNRLRDAFAETCRRAMLAPRLEEGGRCDGDRSRPADVLVPVWDLGRPAAFDFTVTNPLNPTHMMEASVSVESTLESAEAPKHAENDAKCDRLGWTCVPMAVSVFGGWGREARTTYQRVAALLCTQTEVHTAQSLSLRSWGACIAA